MSSHSINAENRLQAVLKNNYSDEKVKRCKQELNDSLELDKVIFFVNEILDDLMTYKFLITINGKAKVPR